MESTGADRVPDYGVWVRDGSNKSAQKNVLVADLDGSLIKTDLLIESFLSYIKTGLTAFLAVIAWLMKGKAELKWQLARKIFFNPENLPYNQMVLDHLKSEKAKGRYLVLASASNSLLVESVARYLDIFDEVVSSSGKNLSGVNKAELLVERYGRWGFEYIGNSNDDVPVWKSSAGAVIVSSSSGMAKSLAERSKVKVVSEIVSKPPLSAWIRAIRLHQWLKNMLVFVPLFASHRVFDWSSASKSMLAFLLFGLCASSIYILNDFLDLQEDRSHRSKKKRAFASGELMIMDGVKLLLFMVGVVAAVLYLMSNLWLAVVVLVYLVSTTLYSFWLKRVMMADVVVLAALYTIRIVAGGVATGVALSMWLLAFSVFAFCGLALLKRYGEFSDGGGKFSGRGYQSSDTPILAALGSGASFGSVMVLVLYINDPVTASMYSRPECIWATIPLLLYWFGRVWILAGRGLVNDDPVLFAAKDRVSILCFLLTLISFFVAL